MVKLTKVMAEHEQAKRPGLKTLGNSGVCPGAGAAANLSQPPQGQVSPVSAVCDVVDECQTVIRQRIDEFFAACLTKAAPWVEDLLDGKQTISQTPFYAAVLPQQELDAHIEELRRLIEEKVRGYFGVTALAVIPRIDLAVRLDVMRLHGLFAEYRRTLLVMHLAAAISNRACHQGFNGLKAPFLLEELLEKLAIGSKLLQVANCCPRQNRAGYRKAMLAQAKGVVQTLRKQLSAEACYQAAVSFYELYDLLGEPQPGPKTA